MGRQGSALRKLRGIAGMPSRKTELKAEAGVRLTLVEEVTPLGTVRASHYRLTTLRPNQQRVLARLETAEEAFDLEVIASLMDPVVQALVTRH
ncbi:hypothetical protein MMB232_01011 [Brevundimonas subvibrioides]|uniref:hypothetical protein n=1 Tax=Brevundimonas subvibrioides TaxID=74313 RepID=UPI0032D58C5F